MFKIVSHLTEEAQLYILKTLEEPLKLSPLQTFVMPERGISRKINCSGICDECFLGKRTFNVSSTSTGPWGWVSNRCGYHYVNVHPLTKQPFPPIPDIIVRLARRTAERYGYTIEPQSGYINLYQKEGSLGLHQDKDEKTMEPPVISLSLGADALFLIGGKVRNDPVEEILLHSGDVMLMGGEHRLAFHGVKRILPNTTPEFLGLPENTRINITIRQYE